MVARISLSILMFLLSNLALSQNSLFSANARLEVQRYAPKKMHGNAQVFSITQDNRGVMYFANQVGVLEYDGSQWRKIEIDNREEVNCATTSPDGIVHIGGQDVFGNLIPDSKGKLHYNSLTSELPDTIQGNIGLVKRIVFSKQYKIIQTEKNLIYINTDTTFVIPSETAYNNSFFVESKMYVTQKDLGLYQVEDNKLIPLKDGHQFALAEKQIILLTKFSNRWIIVTNDGMLYEIDAHDNIVPLDFDLGYRLISAANIDNTYLSLGTNTDGIRMLDKDLNIVYSIGLEKGLTDPQIKTQFYDLEGNLWLATNKGVSKLEINTPIVFYGKESGIRSTVEGLVKHNGVIHAAALDGVYYFEKDGTISRIPGITTDCYGLRSINISGKPELFVAEVGQVLMTSSDTGIVAFADGGPYDIVKSPRNPNELIVLHYDGIANYIRNDKGQYELGRYVNDFNVAGDMFNFIVKADGTMLIGTNGTNGVIVTHLDIFDDPDTPVENWTNSNYGLPLASSYLKFINDQLFVATDSGLYYMDGDRFKKSDHFGIDFNNDDRGVHRISVDSVGQVWMVLYDEQNNYEFGYSKLVDGKYVWKSAEFMRHTAEIMHTIYHDSNQVTWLGGPNGIIRYDGKVKLQDYHNFHTLIREVKYGNNVIFSGKRSKEFDSKTVELEYSDHYSISFRFSGTSFIDENNNVYSYMLDGYDIEWSEWGDLTVKEYNLSEGTYTFKVKSKNIYGIVSDVAEFKFTILPPWYRTIWAYITYIILFIVFVYMAILFSIRRVKKQNQRLEETVRDRTAEVVAQKEEVEKQKEIVEEKNRDIMDSIRYAKHIQDAILPSDEFVNECFNDAFILYRPKDIVSGDFYWVKRKDEKILFAAVDCTGHGVPGAFVSIVGNNGLNRAINEFNMTKPGEILDKLTELVIESFKQPGSSEDEVKDGMDIALCSYDPETKVIEYAGANNSLYLIRAGELIEYKPDKQPIGAFEKRRPFNTQTIQVEKGDRIIVFTDGFADQFGGPKGKKLKYKTFKSMLVDNASRPISEYKMILNHSFNQWKGSFEQIDDVCIIGITI